MSKIEETSAVRLKGVGNSLWVTIAPDLPIELIQAELARLFEPLKHLAGTARVVLDTGGQDDDDRLGYISAYLKDTFKPMEIITPAEINRSEEKQFRLKNSRDSLSRHHHNTLVLSGRVRSGQSVHAKKHLIIMGDVNPGCELTAGGDILVIGSLLGTASAGQPNNRKAIILALDFRPLQVKIADLVAAGLPAGDRKSPEFAHIENGAIIVDDYLAANPFKRMPWPVIR